MIEIESIRKQYRKANKSKGLGLFENGKGVGLVLKNGRLKFECEDEENKKKSDDESLSNLSKIFFWGKLIRNLAPDVFEETPNLTKVDFSLSQISSLDEQVFHGLDDLQEINFYRNRLSTLPCRLFHGLTYLSALNFSRNRLLSLDPGTFSKLTRLSKIDFSFNYISHLDSNIFSGLVNLTQIDMKKNRISALNKNIFNGLSKLNKLDLSLNEIGPLLEEDLFNETRNLTEVDFSRNRISQLGGNIFRNLLKLSKIDLSNNQIVELDGNIFIGLTYLTEINFSFNDIAYLDAEVFLNSPSLSFIDFSANRIGEIDPGQFSGLKNLKQINFFQNKITRLNIDQFNGLDNITRIDFSRNFISDLDLGLFAGLHSLVEIDLHSNQIGELSPEVFYRLDKLTKIDFSANQLSELKPDLLTGLTCLVVIDFSSNSITILDRTFFSGLVNLAEINLYRNLLTELDHDQFKGLENLRKINFSRNNISNLDVKLFQDLSNLNEIDFSRNQIAYLDPKLFDPSPYLTEMNFSGNRITALDPGLFTQLVFLTNLNFSRNQIRVLDPGLFRGLTRLTKIDFSHNQIKSIRPELFTGLDSLNEINFRKNLINKLDSSVFKELPNLSKIDFSRNQIRRLDENIFKRSEKLSDINFSDNPLVDLDLKLFEGLKSLSSIDFEFDFKQNFRVDNEDLFNEFYTILPHNNRLFVQTDVFHRYLMTLYLSEKKLDLTTPMHNLAPTEFLKSTECPYLNNFTPLDLFLALTTIPNKSILSLVDQVESLTHVDLDNSPSFRVLSPKSVTSLCKRDSEELLAKLGKYFNVSHFDDCFKMAIESRNEHVAIWLVNTYWERIKNEMVGDEDQEKFARIVEKYKFHPNEHLKMCSDLKWWPFFKQLVEISNKEQEQQLKDKSTPNSCLFLQVFMGDEKKSTTETKEEPNNLLHYIKSSNDSDLVENSSVKKLFDLKWGKLPRFVYQLHFTIKLLFLIFYTLNLDSMRGENNLIYRSVSLLLALILSIEGSFQLFFNFRYFTLTSLFELANFLLCVLNLSLTTHQHKPIFYIVTVIFTYSAVILDLEKFDSIGVYITTYKKIIKQSFGVSQTLPVLAVFSFLFAFKIVYRNSFNNRPLFYIFVGFLIESLADNMNLCADLSVANIIRYLIYSSYLLILPRLVLSLFTDVTNLGADMNDTFKQSKRENMEIRDEYVLKVESGFGELKRLLDKYSDRTILNCVKIGDIRDVVLKLEKKIDSQELTMSSFIRHDLLLLIKKTVSNLSSKDDDLKEVLDRVSRLEDQISKMSKAMDKLVLMQEKSHRPSENSSNHLKEILKHLNKIDENKNRI